MSYLIILFFFCIHTVIDSQTHFLMIFSIYFFLKKKFLNFSKKCEILSTSDTIYRNAINLLYRTTVLQHNLQDCRLTSKFEVIWFKIFAPMGLEGWSGFFYLIWKVRVKKIVLNYIVIYVCFFFDKIPQILKPKQLKWTIQKKSETVKKKSNYLCYEIVN